MAITKQQKEKYQKMKISQLEKVYIRACNNNNLEIIEYVTSSPEIICKVNVFSQNLKGLYIACQLGYIDIVKYILTTKKIPVNPSIEANEVNKHSLLSIACQSGQLELSHFLLTSKELKENSNIHANQDLSFRLACHSGNLDLVKYLLTSNELEHKASINSYPEIDFNDVQYSHLAYYLNGLANAVMQGHLEIVKYLLTSKELTEHADIHAQRESALLFSYSYADNDPLFEYLVESPEIKEHADIYAISDELFKKASLLYPNEFLKDLILKYKIPYSDGIDKFLETDDGEKKREIKSLFEYQSKIKNIEKTYHQLNNEMQNKDNVNARLKI